MRIEAFLTPGPWTSIREASARAERCGFTAVAAPEINADPFLLLSQAAAATAHIQLRTAIAVAFARSPTVVAQAAWDLHVASGGRFVLGLGTQIQAHVERRFGMPWVAPGPRLQDYVEAVRAVWRSWETGARLKHVGEHYKLSLMTPEFSPPACGLTPIPVYTAAVRPAMMRVAARVSDGVRLHGFCTRRYLQEVALKEIGDELSRVGRRREHIEVCGGGFIATGPNEAAVHNMREMVRYRVAFYASTPAYRPVLELHGWQDLGDKLHRMSLRGHWAQMPAEVSDDVLEHFVAAAPYDQLPAAVEARFGGLSDAVEIMAPAAGTEEGLADALASIASAPTPFVAHARGW